MLAATDLQSIEEITHGSITVVLGVAVTVLWRAYQAAVRANSAYQREFLTHIGELSQIPMALDRLRNEILDELRDLRKH